MSTSLRIFGSLLLPLTLIGVACSGGDDGAAGGLHSNNGSGGSGSGGLGQGGLDGMAGADSQGTGGDIIVGDSCDGAVCPDNAACFEERSAAICRCKPGFMQSGAACVDVDECANGTHQCAGTASCHNTAGAYRCDCLPGYSGNGESCADIDECARGTDACASGAECSDTEGGYTCACSTGAGDGFFCKASGACASNPCQNGGACTETPSGFSCQCPSGTSGTTCATTAACSDIHFADPLVEQAVRGATGLEGTLSASALNASGAKSLVLPTVLETPISSLAGLECWTNLESLELGDNAVSDLSPLAGLTRLTHLDVSCNPVTNLTPLSKLIALESLYADQLSGVCEETVELSNLTGVDQLIGLRVLFLGGQDVSNLTPLSKLGRLEWLDLSRNAVSNLAPLTGLKNLEILWLDENPLSSLSGLGSLPRLQQLRVASANLSNISALSGLETLRALVLRDNAIDSAASLAGIPLLSVDLTANALTSVDGLTHLGSFQDVMLMNNQLTTLKPLADASGFGVGGRLWIAGNTLPCSTQEAVLQTLRARGLQIVGNCQP